MASDSNVIISKFEDIAEVDLSDLDDGYILQYDLDSDTWKAVPPSSIIPSP